MVNYIQSTGYGIFDNTLMQPLRVITIDSKGNYSTFCPELMASNEPMFHFGHVNNGPITDALSNSNFIKVYDDILAGQKKCIASCEYFEVCGGGKPSNKYFENNTFDSSETIDCQFTKMLLTDIVLDNLESSNSLQTDLAAYRIN